MWGVAAVHCICKMLLACMKLLVIDHGTCLFIVTIALFIDLLQFVAISSLSIFLRKVF